MRRFSTRSIIAAAAAAVALIASPLAIQPAGAIPANDSTCTYVPPPDGITSAQISWYPAQPGSMSGLEVGCVLQHDTGTSMVSGAYTIHDTEMAMWHNGSARTAIGSTAGTSTTLTLTTAATGLPTGTVNRVITGTGIPARTFITSMTSTVLTLNQAATVPANTRVRIENASGARTVVDGVWAAGAFTVTSATANFSATTDIGLSISGTGIPAYSTIASVAGNTATFTNPGANPTTLASTGIAPDGTVSIGGTLRTTTTREVSNLVTNTTGSRITGSGGFGGWQAPDLGMRVTGQCLNGASPTTQIPADTFVTGTPSQANLDISPSLPTGGVAWTECTIQLGERNATAPVDGDIIAGQGVQLNLSPGLVAGSDDCANEQPEGFALVGKWYSADRHDAGTTGAPAISDSTNGFQGVGLSNTPPAGTKAIGQILFDTSAVDFSAFVIERKLLTAGDPNFSVHYDVVFPFAPTGLALCPISANSPGLSFLLDVEAITATQSAAATGTGRPGTNQVRNIESDSPASPGYVTKVVVDSQSTPWTPATAFERLCIYPAPPSPVNFQCGAG